MSYLCIKLNMKYFAYFSDVKLKEHKRDPSDVWIMYRMNIELRKTLSSVVK